MKRMMRKKRMKGGRKRRNRISRVELADRRRPEALQLWGQHYTTAVGTALHYSWSRLFYSYTTAAGTATLQLEEAVVQLHYSGPRLCYSYI